MDFGVIVGLLLLNAIIGFAQDFKAGSIVQVSIFPFHVGIRSDRSKDVLTGPNIPGTTKGSRPEMQRSKRSLVKWNGCIWSTAW